MLRCWLGGEGEFSSTFSVCAIGGTDGGGGERRRERRFIEIQG